MGFTEVGRTEEMTRGWDNDFGSSFGDAAKMSCESPARRSEGDVPLLAAANQSCTISVCVVVVSYSEYPFTSYYKRKSNLIT